MKRHLISTLYACCLLLYSTACVSEKKNSSSSEKNSIVELTPEFILAVQKYDALGEFCEGLAPVGLEKDGNLLWGYINTKGEEIIPCKIKAHSVGCFSEGLACIVIESKGETYYSFIDNRGKTVFTIDTPHAEFCGEEFCSLVIEKSNLPYFNGGECGLRFFGSDKVVYINKEGKVLREDTQTKDIQGRNDGKYKLFSEGEGYNSVGLKDDNGNVVIPAKYNEIIMGDNEGSVFLATLADTGGDDGLMPDFYVGYVDLKGNDTFPEQLKKKIQRFKDNEESTSPATFAKALQEAKWIESEQGFKYPDIMQKSVTEMEDHLYAIDSYTWGDVQLCYFWTGAWGSEEYFFVKGLIAPNTSIRDVTYTSGDINELFGSFIASGHTSDGRIFYLKRYTVVSDVPHPNFLVLVYPEKFQKEVGPLIEEVRKWHIH